MKELLTLFVSFARIGAFTFGGGYAMLPMIQQEIVDRRGWATEEEVLDYYAIGQCTPGVIAVNTATFVGYKQHGFWGGIFATAGVVVPSVVIITIIAAFIKNFAELEAVRHAFAGIRVAVAVLVVNAVIKLWKTGVKDAFGVVLFLVVFALSVTLDLSPVYYVVAAIVLGILVMRAKRAGGKA